MTNRIRLGIEGFKHITIKPLPEKIWIGLVGEAGAGKSVMSITSVQYHLEKGKNAIFVTTEMSADQVIDQARSFGYDWEGFIKEGSLVIMDSENQKWDANGNAVVNADGGNIGKKSDLLEFTNFVDGILYLRNFWELNEPTLLVIDSVAGLWEDKPAMSRKYFRYIKRRLRIWFSLVFVTSQLSVGTNRAFGFGIEHGVDSIFRMGHFFQDGEVLGWIICQKMRGVPINKRLLRTKIDSNGFSIGEPVQMEGRHATVYDAFSG